MTPIGSEISCAKWILPENQSFDMMELGYDSAGPTYLRARTSSGIEFERGRLKSTDSSTYQYFTEDNPFIGMQGYETESVFTALGFIRYNCTGAV